MDDSTLILSLTILFIATWLVRHTCFSRLPLPPGPKGYPLVGNLNAIPDRFPWIKFQEWSNEYQSEIIHVRRMGTSTIILNSWEAANELLAKRSSIYSSRPPFWMMQESGFGWMFAFKESGEYWKSHRALFEHEFGPTDRDRYQPQTTKYVAELLNRLLDTPEKVMDHMRHITGAIIVSISYGIDVQPEGDRYVETAEKALDAISQVAVQGTYLVDHVPLLRFLPEWFPGADFKQKAKQYRSYAIKMIRDPFLITKQNMVEGTAKPSFTSRALENIDSSTSRELQENLIQETAANLYVAGSDTIVSSLNTFVLAMLLWPEAQTKAQEELDEVLGQTRLPTFADEDSLPYVTALVNEVLRWRPVTPLCIARMSVEDDEYNGYHIPANSVIFPNVWAMFHDEAMYPDPETFRPERFLKEGKLNPAVRDPTAVFGFGRRICPGRHLAFATLWLTAASVLATMRIGKGKRAGGPIAEPLEAYSSGLMSHPLPFECSIAPRSKEAKGLVRNAIVEP